MNIAIITGSCGLVGSESVRHFAKEGFDKIIGIDNDMRALFFGESASTGWMQSRLEEDITNYQHINIDIRDREKIENLFNKYGNDIKLVVHTAAQPSHDWAAKDVHTDFSVNALGTLNLLEATRNFAPSAVFIFCSTNKVYGDLPNSLPLTEKDTRWEIESSHPYHGRGIDEMMSIDKSKHSLFGVSKASADLLVQEYGRYFGMNTVCFRGGCLTGPAHSGAELHGFLSYLVMCVVTGRKYSVFGYKGKQVRDNIHSDDLVNAFGLYYNTPKPAQVYNIGGGIYSNCSVLEAFDIAEKITGKKADFDICDENRIGDHIWYISDLSKFINDYPAFSIRKNVETIIGEIVSETEKRLAGRA